MTKDDELRQWLNLYHLPSLSIGLYPRLLRAFKTPAAILGADMAALAVHGVTHTLAREMRDCDKSPDATRKTAEALNWCEHVDQHIVTFADPFYPPLLREIPDPPPLLFVCGQLQALLMPQIAIVGSRRCSVDGREVATALAADLASQGLSVCSGLAMGIDSAAHAGALKVEGATVAVQGTGADRVYPPGNRALARRILERGALLSELPLGSSAQAAHFPKRNRIISGMSLGVIVVEAALQSGSLITARLAMEQNREVFAVPGSVRNPLCRGTHRLIRDGVTLIETSDQVLEQLGSLVEGHLCALQLSGVVISESDNGKVTMQSNSALTEEERIVLTALGYDPVLIDALVERTGISASEVQSALLTLELNGKVHCEAGRYTLL
ncbi:MAG: DNA-processing protein DprA [Gammaproteobacteria bacterium]|nr:DNA-processing protein DprA [Gammaproteobacteria bacterium]MDP2139686.1 DNA-processing protein DprA [Gammaproteobacteria bacterium]MDP2348890.1 DNA-processing protein DprA [Gammaproteobacteria bacterium]